MRKTILAALAVLFLWASAGAQTPGVVAISVTNTATNITVDATCSQMSCLSVVVKENSASPTAIFSIKPTGSATAVNIAAGGSFEFDASTSAPFPAGRVLGTITATTSGPFSFVAIESAARATNANGGSSGGGGGGGGSSEGAAGTYQMADGAGGFLASNCVQSESSGNVALSCTDTSSAGIGVTTDGGIVSANMQAAGGTASISIEDLTGTPHTVAMTNTSGFTDSAQITQGISGWDGSGNLTTVPSTTWSSAGDVSLSPLFTDNDGSGAGFEALQVSPMLAGSNVSGDSVAGVLVRSGVEQDGAASVYGVYIETPNEGEHTVTNGTAGIWIENQVTDGAADTWGIKIDDQTSESGNHYAILTGLGAVSFGDTLGAGPTSLEQTFRGDTDPGGTLSALQTNSQNETAIAITDIEGILVRVNADDGGGSATTLNGIELSGFTGGETQTGILIHDVMGGVTGNYAIKTGAGVVSFGDQVDNGLIAFASLGTPGDGAQVYCPDCDTPLTEGAACSSSGDMAGALAQRLRGTWKCF